jgi:hypothetical protein
MSFQAYLDAVQTKNLNDRLCRNRFNGYGCVSFLQLLAHVGECGRALNKIKQSISSTLNP